MLLFFYLIASYVIFTLVDESVLDDSGFTQSWITLVAFVLTSLFVFYSARLLSKLSLRSILHQNFKKANAYRNLMVLFAITLFVILVFEFHWRHFIIGLNIFGTSPGKIPIVRDLLFVLPAILNYCLIMPSQYSIDRFTRGKEYNFRAYFDFNFRLLLTPLPLIIFISAAKYLYLYIDQNSGFFTKLEYVAPTMAVLLVLLPVFVIALFFPVIIRFILRTKVLPQSEIRKELREVADQAKVKYRNILIWQTGALRIPNAMVVGFFSWVRYVFITDTILNDFSPDETKGVYAHEIGHAKHAHLLAYFLTLIVFTLFSFIVLEPLSLKLGFILQLGSGDIFILNQLVASVGIIFIFGILIGFFSRRFERQADLFASRLIGFSNFIDALYGIARIYGGRILTKPSITHGSLQSRINFLYQAEYDQHIADRFDRNMKAFKLILLLLVVLVSVLTANAVYSESKHFEHKSSIYNAMLIVDNFENQGYFTQEDETDIAENLEKAKSDPELLPEIQFVQAMKILESRDNKQIPDAKKLLESAYDNKSTSLYTRLNIQNTLEQLN